MKHANPMRLDDKLFKYDLKKFLLKEGGINEDFSPIGSYVAVWNWILSYDKKIEENNKKILQLCREKIPNRYITITPSPSGEIGSFTVNIYGVRDNNEYKKNHAIMYDFVSKLENDFLDSEYCFLIHNVTLRDTVNFYDNEKNELIRLGFATQEECEEIAKQEN